MAACRALARARASVPSLIDEVTGLEADRSRRRSVPDRPQVGRRRRPAGQPHYLVCNADESEPGTFKDRVLLEGDPFAIVEAMTIAAFATGATKGYLYIRGEYPPAEARVRHAIARARERRAPRATSSGSGFAFDIELRRGAGAYICGEETALFESIEGKRGEPRNKPPFPVEVGLFGKPTVVNNVETLANVPRIVRTAARPSPRIGTEGSTGPKLFCLSGPRRAPRRLRGRVRGDAARADRAGRRRAGRPRDPDDPARWRGRRLRRARARSTCRSPSRATRAAGATLGSGVIMVFDETADLVDTLRRIAQFFRDESCGQCVPCRVGTVRQEELLARLAAGSQVRPRDDELALLREIGQAMRDASICGLGQTASSAIESALRQPGLVAL